MDYIDESAGTTDGLGREAFPAEPVAVQGFCRRRYVGDLESEGASRRGVCVIGLEQLDDRGVGGGERHIGGGVLGPWPGFDIQPEGRKERDRPVEVGDEERQLQQRCAGTGHSARPRVASVSARSTTRGTWADRPESIHSCFDLTLTSCSRGSHSSGMKA